MAYKFRCRSCGHDIFVRYLKPGEMAQCKWCGTANMVKDDEYRISEEEYLRYLGTSENLPAAANREGGSPPSEDEKNSLINRIAPLIHGGFASMLWGMYCYARTIKGLKSLLSQASGQIMQIYIAAILLGMLAFTVSLAYLRYSLYRLNEMPYNLEDIRMRHLWPYLVVALFVIILETVNALL